MTQRRSNWSLMLLLDRNGPLRGTCVLCTNSTSTVRLLIESVWKCSRWQTLLRLLAHGTVSRCVGLSKMKRAGTWVANSVLFRSVLKSAKSSFRILDCQGSRRLQWSLPSDHNVPFELFVVTLLSDGPHAVLLCIDDVRPLLDWISEKLFQAVFMFPPAATRSRGRHSSHF